MTSELAIHPSLRMSIIVSTLSRAASSVSKWEGSVFRAARTFSRTFQTPTGMMYPGWASRMMTAPAVLPSSISSSFTAILEA